MFVTGREGKEVIWPEGGGVGRVLQTNFIEIEPLMKIKIFSRWREGERRVTHYPLSEKYL